MRYQNLLNKLELVGGLEGINHILWLDKTMCIMLKLKLALIILHKPYKIKIDRVKDSLQRCVPKKI